jgi:hypothetical protein
MPDDYMPIQDPKHFFDWLKKFNTEVNRLRDPSVPGPIVPDELRNAVNDKDFRFDESRIMENRLSNVLQKGQDADKNLEHTYHDYQVAEQSYVNAQAAVRTLEAELKKVTEEGVRKARPLADMLNNHIDMSDRIRKELGILGAYTPLPEPLLRNPAKFVVKHTSSNENQLTWDPNGNAPGTVYTVEYGICDIAHGGKVVPPMEGDYQPLIKEQDHTICMHSLPKPYAKGQLRYRIRAKYGNYLSSWIEATEATN